MPDPVVVPRHGRLELRSDHDGMLYVHDSRTGKQYTSHLIENMHEAIVFLLNMVLAGHGAAADPEAVLKMKERT